jgi:hypothetical protein
MIYYYRRYRDTEPLLNSPCWSSPKNFRFRKFWRSYLDQNLLRITNPVSDLTGDHTKLHTRPVATGVFFLTRFFHNFLKNDAQDLKKNGLERRIPRFCTICDKNQPLNEKIEKVMAILVPRWA